MTNHCRRHRYCRRRPYCYCVAHPTAVLRFLFCRMKRGRGRLMSVASCRLLLLLLQLPLPPAGGCKPWRHARYRLPAAGCPLPAAAARLEACPLPR